MAKGFKAFYGSHVGFRSANYMGKGKAPAAKVGKAKARRAAKAAAKAAF